MIKVIHPGVVGLPAFGKRISWLALISTLVVALLASCGENRPDSDPDDGLILSSNACAELAEGVTIDPDPASLGLGVTIHILGSTGGLVIPDTLVGITISDASGATIRGYGWEAITFPDGVTASSGNGWEWTETFDSGEPGRWTVRVEYLTAGADRKSQDGSFCVNDDQPGQASSSQSRGSPITGRVVAPPLADETPAADPTPAESASQPTLVPPSEPAPSVPAGEFAMALPDGRCGRFLSHSG